MADGYTFRLNSDLQRQRAKGLIDRAPPGYEFSVTAPKRTNDQNAKMHAMLADIALAKPEGRCLTPDVWKALFLHALDHDIRLEPALDGRGMIPIGFRSSRLSKQQFSDLIEIISEYGARHSVRWSDEQAEAA